MSIQQWALEVGVKGIIKSAEPDGRVSEFVKIADSLVSGAFPGGEKDIKQMIVQYVIIPFCKQWLKDDIEGLKKAFNG